MKRASKPPTPPNPSGRDDRSRPARVGGGIPGAPPPLPSAARNLGPFAGPAPHVPRSPLVTGGPDPMSADLEHDDLETHRPPAPTIPFVPTPGGEWPTSPGPEAEHRRPPSSHNIPTAPKRPPSDRSMEAALRDQMWSGLQPSQTAQTAQTGPHRPIQLQHPLGHAAPLPPAAVRSPPAASASGTYATISEQRGGSSVPRSDRTPPPEDEGWPLGYVVASAFFLAVAVVGFGLWLAFEVIAL